MAEQRTLVKNAGDPEQVRNAGKREKHNREKELYELRGLLRMPEFRRLAWRYMEKCNILGSVYTGEALGTAYNEGQRMVGNAIMQDILDADPDAYVTMLKESRFPETPKKKEEEDNGGTSDD
jgi:hypothetical protein